MESDTIDYIRNGKSVSVPVAQFIKFWSGIVLLAETSPDSIEPDYKVHRKKDLLQIAQQSILALAGGLILALTYINNNVYLSPGFSLLLFVNLTGIYICYLLVLKQLRIHSRYADKICMPFLEKQCII